MSHNPINPVTVFTPKVVITDLKGFFLMGGKPMEILTVGDKCAFCGRIGKHTDEPYGWEHPAPPCSKFSLALTNLEMSSIKVSEGKWEVVSEPIED